VAVNVQNEVQQQVQYFHAADYGPQRVHLESRSEFSPIRLTPHP
jgi:hypothetical protein